MRTFRLIHGIHSPEGNNSMSALYPVMQKVAPKAHVALFEYGFMGFWKARWANDGVAKRLAEVSLISQQYVEQEVWITHSNGAAVAYLAVRDCGARPSMIININPALDRNLVADVPAVEVLHSNGDRAVYWSQFLPFHLWGDQGRVGYRGDRDTVINHEASAKDFGRMSYQGHMDLFQPDRIWDWAHFMHHRADERLGVL